MNQPIARPGAMDPEQQAAPEVHSSVHRLTPISPAEQARRVQAFEEALREFDSMPDNDPPGAWEEAMRDLDAHRPHRKLFEGIV